jgi:hypothetical protein
MDLPLPAGAARMPRKSYFRRVAGNRRIDGSRFIPGTHYLHWGMLTAMVWAGPWVKGEDNGASPTTGRAHILSPEIVQAVIQKLPKYAPPTPAKTAPERPADEGKDSSHDVLHLPKLTVKERPPRRPSDFELLTPKGRLELVLKKYPGLRIGNFFGMNNGIALAMQAEERKLEEKAALTDTVRRSTTDNSPESKKLMRLINDAFRGPNNDWATSGGPMK